MTFRLGRDRLFSFGFNPILFFNPTRSVFIETINQPFRTQIFIHLPLLMKQLSRLSQIANDGQVFRVCRDRNRLRSETKSILNS
jgi:hypothetical protein